MSERKSILVSRNLKSDSVLREWCSERNIDLIEAPFIRIDPVLDVEIPATDWIFFSSPNGLDIYFNHYPLMAPKIGVYGAGTESRLKLKGIQADFVGDTAKTPLEIGEEFFGSIVASDTVLFPLSQLSKKSIAGTNKVNKVIEKVVYTTTLDGSEVPNVDLAILTSPSNIDGYLLKNIVGETKFIVLGETSRNYFQSLVLTEEIYVPKSASEEKVILLLEQLL
ncbi:MAG: uroporphyrinogen-III synthase [Crocinitomicaceae bacterium]